MLLVDISQRPLSLLRLGKRRFLRLLSNCLGSGRSVIGSLRSLEFRFQRRNSGVAIAKAPMKEDGKKSDE
jgi:hypothetical protein